MQRRQPPAQLFDLLVWHRRSALMLAAHRPVQKVCATRAAGYADAFVMRYLIGRYHEVALKGQNRWRFTAQLKRNLLDLMGDYRLGTVRSEGPRLLVELPDELPDAVAIERGALVFGLQNFTLSRAVAPDLKTIEHQALAAVHGTNARSFAVRTRRENKNFPLNSMEIDREIGG